MSSRLDEVGFALTVGAYGHLGEICPGNDINRIGELFDFSESVTAAKVDALAKAVAIMSRAWCDAVELEGDISHPAPLTEDEVKAMPISAMREIPALLMEAMSESLGTSIEVESTESEKKSPAAEG